MTGEISNHLWQSTLLAVAAGLLTVALRRNQARIRYWIWFSASVKFFVPFGLLITFGSRLEWAPTAQQITPPAVSSAIAQIGQPFSDFSFVAESTAPSPRGDEEPLTVAILALVWMSGAIALALIRLRLWRRVRDALRASTRCYVPGIPSGVDVRSAPGLMEPGVVGWWHPVLLVPQGIEDHLTPQQLDAVIAHELCHIRRRDNLTSTIHMVVEAVFWFYPLVWWIGTRLIEERERACDEEVLRLGGDPQIYAEGILNVCRRYAEAPLVCVSGVSGANLRKRVEAIMMNRVGRRLNIATKAALAAAAMTVLTLPVVVGAMSPAAHLAMVTTVAGVTPAAARPQSAPLILADAPSFEVASVKPSAPDVQFPGIRPIQTGRFTAVGLTVRDLVQLAYGSNGMLLKTQVVEGPSWIDSERFDILATSDRLTGLGEPFDTVRGLLQTLLRDRFSVRLHIDSRDLPIYALVLARNDRRPGPQLRPPTPCTPAGLAQRPDANTPGCGFQRAPRGQYSGRNLPLALLATNLAFLPEVGRVVRDRTGLQGGFDLELKFDPEALSATQGADRGPSIFTALEEQLGLKLEPTRGPVEVVVIDGAERPTPN